jgi:alpha-1,6-mannosyltransferase
MMLPDMSFRTGTAAVEVRHLQRAIWVLGGLSFLGYAFILARLGVHPVLLRWGFPLQDFIPFFLGLFGVLFALALLGAYWAFKEGTNDGRIVAPIVGFGVLFRLLLLPTPPVLSSDVFRYVWDGRVQAAGENPYLSTPASVATEREKQEPLYQQQNRPFARTIYPPLAELAFRLVHRVAGDTVTAMKALMFLGDLCTLALLLRLLTALELPRSRILLYAWHPLAVVESAGSGHVDALAVPGILLAVLLWQRGRTMGPGVALGTATLMKIFPIALLPAFFERRRWRILLWFSAAVGLVYLPFFVQAGPGVLGHLPRFLADPGEVFNPSIMGILLYAGRLFTEEPTPWVSWIGRGALLVLLIRLGRGDGLQRTDLLAGIWRVGALLTLLTSTLHPWYLLWLLPFLSLQPRPAFVYLSGAVALSYALYLAPSMPARVAIGLLEYVPFILLLGRPSAPLPRIAPSVAHV